MTLIKCTKCGAEIEGKTSICPHCGALADEVLEETESMEHSQEEENSESEKRIKWKNIFAGAGLLTLGALTFLSTGNLRAYRSAQRLMRNHDYLTASYKFQNLGEYRDAAKRYKECQSLYKECCYIQARKLFDKENYREAEKIYSSMSDYKDSEAMLEKCKFWQSTDGAFLLALAEGLMKRWDYNEDESVMSPEEFKKYRTQAINVEIRAIEDFIRKEFEDADLKKSAEEYRKALKKQLEAVDCYGTDDMKFSAEWEEGYNTRCLLIKKFAEQYGLKVESRYDADLEDFIHNAEAVEEEQRVQKQVEAMPELEFRRIRRDYDDTYEAMIENTTDAAFSSFSVKVILYDKNNAVADSTYTNQLINFKPGEKGKLSFTTHNKKFVRLEYESVYYIR